MGLLTSCGDAGPPDTGDTTDTGEPGFDDHSVPGFDATADIFAWADLGSVPVQVKFVLTDFSAAEPGPAFFLSPTFYTLHDEWYWFRLLNGVPIPGLDEVAPVSGYELDTIAAVYDAFVGVNAHDLPLDLTWAAGGERLYSPAFYDLGLNDEPRFFGLGSLLYHPANPDRVVPEALWLFELEFVDDDLDLDRVTSFFTQLAAALPPEVGSSVRWLARSPEQEALAAEIAAGPSPYAERTLTYKDLVVEGEVEAYNSGIVAGRIRRLGLGELGGASVGPTDIVVLDGVPDYLPPVAAIVTAVPQTPLAHLNLLAKSRGTPNVYVAGVFEDQALQDWEYWSKYVILQVSPEGVAWKVITKAQYEGWLDLQGTAELSIPQVDLADVPYTRSLTDGGLAEVSGLVPSLGGKSAGFLAFNDFPDVTAPPEPLAISIRGYAEHIAAYRPVIEGLLGDDEFDDDARVRFLVLEGEDDFAAEHAGDPKSLQWLSAFMSTHDGQSFLGSVVALGGLKAALRDWPLEDTFEAELLETLGARFASLGQLQGLRFRSSSTAEDVQGFNGAGLYDSNSGYLHPELQPTPKLQKRSVAWALRKTWASYWSFEAFEERRLAGIDHLSGNMGVLVHPRFDDELELANGVITLWLAREPAGARRSMVVNVQAGAVSVTNPDPDNPAAPEITEVSAIGDATPALDRVQGSSLLPDGELVLEDADLMTLFAWTDGLADAWLDQSNTAWPPAQQRSTLVLDFEFKDMAQGWPALAAGDPLPERLVLKQVRTLESPIRVPAEVLALPVPRDLLEQVLAAERWTCEAPGLVVTADLFWTDPAQTWALDYAASPLVASVSLELSGAALGHADGYTLVVDHTQFAATAADDDGWALTVALDPATAAEAELDTLSVADGGAWALTRGGDSAEGGGVSCAGAPLLQSGTVYLQTLLAAE